MIHQRNFKKTSTDCTNAAVKIISSIRVACMFLVALLIVSAPDALIASNNGAAFIENGVSARSVSLGQSIVSTPFASDAIYWNPALLSREHGSDIEISAFNAFETQFYSGFVSYPLSVNWSIGAGLIGASTDGIRESVFNSSINRYVLTGDNHHYRASALYLSSGYAVNKDLSLGVNVKGIQEEAAGFNGTGVGVDISAHYQFNHYVDFGILAKNVVEPAIEWNTPSRNIDHAPQEVLLGASASLLEDTLLISTGTRIRSNRDSLLRVGAEYFIDPRLALRAGHNGEHISLGLGLRLNKFRIDVSWTNPDLDVIEDMYRFSIGYRID